MLSQSRLKGDGGCFGGDGGSTDDPSTPLASSCHSRANQSNSFLMNSLVSFARSSRARAFARQYSGFNTPALYDLRSTHVRAASLVIAIARSSRRGAAGFRLVQKMGRAGVFSRLASRCGGSSAATSSWRMIT